MNRSDTLERDLTLWFADAAAPRVPDYVDDLVQATARVPQRPVWMVPERWFPMSVITLAQRTFRPVPWRMVGLLAVIALLIASLVVAYVGSRPAVPPPFGLATNGSVAFGTSNDIVVLDPGTGRLTTVVSGVTTDNFPIYSSDGQRIAFERERPGGVKLFAVGADGGEPLELTKTDLSGIFGLQWAPDGQRLAFAAEESLWVVQADGSGAAPLEMDASVGGFPMWRPPSGSDILFAGTQQGVSGTFLVHPDGSGLRLVMPAATGQAELAMWTPDGARIVINRAETDTGGNQIHRVHVLDLDAAGAVQHDRIVGPTLERGWSGYGLSPDGTRVLELVRQAAAADDWRVGVMSIDLSTAGSIVETGPTFSGSSFGYGWAPDGTQVVVSDVDHGKTWLLDAAGGPERLANWPVPDGGSTWQRGAA